MKKNLYVCLGLALIVHTSQGTTLVINDSGIESGPFKKPEPFLEPEEMKITLIKESNDFIKNKSNKHKPKWQK